MKLSTKILSTVAVSAILATSASAYGMGQGKGGWDCPLGMNGNCPQGMNQGYGKGMMGQGYNKGMMRQGQGKGMRGGCGMSKGQGGAGIMPLLRQINLSDSQVQEVQKIMQDVHKDMPSKYNAFSKDGFDKDAYVKQMQDQRDARVKRQAEVIDRVYDILDDKQKNQLRVLMDLKEERMKERFNFDKNRNGGR